MTAFSAMYTALFADPNLSESAVYEGQAIRAMIVRDAQLVGEFGQVLGQKTIATLSLSQVQPEIGAELLVGETEYRIARIISSTDLVAVVELAE